MLYRVFNHFTFTRSHGLFKPASREHNTLRFFFSFKAIIGRMNHVSNVLCFFFLFFFFRGEKNPCHEYHIINS